MKIAYLSHLDMNLYLFRLPVMQKMVELGHEVYAVCPKGEFEGKFEVAGISEVHYHIERKSLNPLTELKALWEIYRTLKTLAPDILHTFTAKPNIYGAIAGRWAKIPVIVSTVTGLGSFFIDTSFKARMIQRVIKSLYRSLLHQTNATIFQNSTDRHYFMKQGLVPKSKARLVRSSGVDTRFFHPDCVAQESLDALKSELGMTEGRVVVMMIARAIWHKGIAEYLEAAQKARQKESNILFYLVGGTDDGNHSCVPSTTLKNQPFVMWLGERQDIRELLALSDIVVLPSYREGVPRTLLEASAMAKPMVATDTVGCTEVVRDGVNGYLVPLKDSDILSERILKLAASKDVREAMGKKAREIALEEFDVKIVVEQYLQIYEKLGR